MKIKPGHWLAAGLALEILLGLSLTAFQNPRTVTITHFTATLVPNAQAIQIHWETAGEINISGYYVRRSTEPESGYIRASDLILFYGAAANNSYTYLDADVDFNMTYYYELEIIDNNQQASIYGPITITIGNTPIATYTSEPTETGTLLATQTPTLAQTSIPGTTATFTYTPSATSLLTATPGTPGPGQPTLPPGATLAQPITPLPTEAISGNPPTPKPASTEEIATNQLTPDSGGLAIMPTALSDAPLAPEPSGAGPLTQTALAGQPTEMGTSTATTTPSVPTQDPRDSTAWIEIALGGLVAGGLFAGLFLAVRKSVL